MAEASRPPAGARTAPGASWPGSVTVIVTVLEDPRVERTLTSLLGQTRAPEEIIVDDGSTSGVVKAIADRFRERDQRVRHLRAPGSIAEGRNTALAVARGELIVFLDADEIAPAGWLAALLAPFADPAVGFTGGPTPAARGTTRSAAARYYDGYLRRFYDTQTRADPASLPMGNSAWRARLFRELGPLDTSMGRGSGNEDQEFAVRAVRAGWRGRYVPEAWVDHDFSDLDARSILRKQRRYARGGFYVWRARGHTVEATYLRLLPYVLPPALLAIGLLMLIPPATVGIGEVVGLAGVGGLGALALGLTLWGHRLEPRYPGLRYASFEILRRWATLLGALEGMVRYRSPAPVRPPGDPTAPPPTGGASPAELGKR